MKSEKPTPGEVEIIDPKEELVTSSRGTTDVKFVLRVFFSCPPIQPVKRPQLSVEELGSSFLRLFGHAIIFEIQCLEYFISPDGILRAFTKLFVRLLIKLTMLALVIGIPLLIAANLLEQSAISFEDTMWHFMWGCIWLTIATILVAGLITILIVGFKIVRNRINYSNSRPSNPRR